MLSSLSVVPSSLSVMISGQSGMLTSLSVVPSSLSVMISGQCHVIQSECCAIFIECHDIGTEW